MSIFPKMTLTNKGKALQAKLQIGDTMEFTRMGLGSGELDKPIVELLNLINETASVSINNKQIIQEYTVQLRAFFTNVDVQERFYWKEFGIFANDPDEGEILYAYPNAGDMGGWIPAVTDNRIERMIYASVQVSNAGEINITIPQSDTFIPTSEKGQPNGVAELDEDGKIPQEQLPELNFDPAGSAAAVQDNLNAHTTNRQNPHGVTAVQVGAYDKNQSLTSATAQLFGLDVSAVPDAVFNKIKTLIDSANNNANSKTIMITGTYTGSGDYDSNLSKSINLGFQPKAVIIMSSSGELAQQYDIYGGLAMPNNDCVWNHSTAIKITSNGFNVYNEKVASNYYIRLNHSGTVYYYLAFQ